MDRLGTFHRTPRLDDTRLAEVFAREVLKLREGRVGYRWGREAGELERLSTGSSVNPSSGALALRILSS